MLRLIAHRGLAATHPENTLPALAAAIAGAADGVEFDLQFTTDGEPVLLHDATLDRVSGRAGSVWALSAAEVAGWPAHEPGRLGPAHVGVGVPLLTDAVALLRAHPDIQVFAELKAETLGVLGLRASLARVRRTLSPVLSRTWLISFLPEAVAEARAQGFPRVGWCLPGYDTEVRRTAEALAPDLLFADQADLGLGAEPLWPGPWTWASWEFGRDAVRARALAARGLAWAETYDVPGLRAALGP